MRKVNMIKMSCPYCEAIHNVKEIKRTESIVFKGKNVTYDAIHYECSNCHEVFDQQLRCSISHLHLNIAPNNQIHPPYHRWLFHRIR